MIPRRRPGSDRQEEIARSNLSQHRVVSWATKAGEEEDEELGPAGVGEERRSMIKVRGRLTGLRVYARQIARATLIGRTHQGAPSDRLGRSCRGEETAPTCARCNSCNRRLAPNVAASEHCPASQGLPA